MKRKFLIIVAVMGLVAASAAPAPPIQSDEKEVKEVMDLLKTRYVNPAAISDKNGGRGALNDILGNLNGGAVLLSEPSLVPASYHAIYTEILPDKVGYWRVQSFKPAKDWATLQNQLKEWTQQGVIGIIVDVRDFEAINEFSEASQAASLFCPPGTTFFSVQGLQIPQQVYHSSSLERYFSKPVVILMNGRTVGAAEAFAASMRASCGAILLGRSSDGLAALFQENKLSSGRYLRLAVGRVALADGTQLYGKPITPDIDIYVNDEKEAEALKEETTHSDAAPLVQELPMRGHLSEAALVRDETPELDEALADQLHENKKVDGKDHSQLQDMALMRGMDVLRAIDLSQRPKPVN